MERYRNLLNRDVNGILLLDKPLGFSSNFVLNKIKKLFFANKAGYTGTLDPFATGMLPICFGKSTKFAKDLLNADKRYKVVAKLGESTDTFDATGLIIHVSSIQFTEKKLEWCLESFRGESYQIPPMFSAIKYEGLPLYKYARKGINIIRKSRLIYVYELCIIQRKSNIIELDIQCSKGTYIRSIINDIGKCLGCGAHVMELRRLMVGQYNFECMINLKTLESIFYDFNLSDSEVLNNLDKFLI